MIPPAYLRIFSRYRGLLAWLTVLAIAALPLFGHLDEPPVQVWDELRNGENALEMNQTGRLIVTTYDFVPETWNTKPPLLIWILALSFRLLGNNELALRLPSALAALGTCLILLRFAWRHTGRWMPGIIAAAILVTIPGYVNTHGTRTGDYDALLVFCTTAALFCLFNYLEYERARWLYLAAAALAAAVLTKGVAGLFVVPAMLAYVLIQRKAMRLLRERGFYISLAAFLLITGGYYVLRELQQPGFLHAVYMNELGGRYNTLIPGIDGSDVWTYYHELVNVAFAPWILLLIPAVCAGFLARQRRWRRVALLCSLTAVTVLLVLSGATTRLWWYMMPIYPGLALLCGMFVTEVLAVLGRRSAVRPVWRFHLLLPAVLLLTLLAGPYNNILERTIGEKFPKRSPDVHDAGVYLKEVNRGMRPLGGQIMCGENPLPLRWYQEALRERGLRLDLKNVDSLGTGEQVMAWDEPTKTRIRQQYRQHETENFRCVTVYRIEGRVGE